MRRKGSAIGLDACDWARHGAGWVGEIVPTTPRSRWWGFKKAVQFRAPVSLVRSRARARLVRRGGAVSLDRLQAGPGAKRGGRGGRGGSLHFHWGRGAGRREGKVFFGGVPVVLWKVSR